MSRVTFERVLHYGNVLVVDGIGGDWCSFRF
jgi:hypothetical protein